MRGQTLVFGLMVAAIFAAIAGGNAPALFGQSIVGLEGLVVAPNNVPSNQSNIELTVVALDRELFARPSGRAPEFEFGPGITIKSVTIESGKLARVVIDTADSAFGAIEARVKIYSLDASTVTVLSSTYVGATGPVSNGPLSVRAIDNRRVEVDTVTPQTIGTIEITGPLSGPVSVACPTGTTIAAGRTPVVRSQTVGASITGLSVNADRTGFTFSVVNAAFSNVTLSVGDVVLDLRGFTTAGGERGGIPMTYTVTGISQSVAVSSAHTPGQTVENPTDEFLAPDDSTDDSQTPTAGLPPEDDNATDGNGSPVTSNDGNYYYNPNTNSSSSRTGTEGGADAAERNDRGNRNRTNRNNRGNRGERVRGRTNPANQPQQAFAAQPAVRNAQPGIADAASSENLGAPAPAGEAKPAAARAVPPNAINAAPPVATGRILTPKSEGEKAVRVESFVLCDERFAPLPALGFKSGGDGTFKARVWVQLVLNTVLSRDMENRLEVMIQVPGSTPIRTILYETGPNSGVYRCAPEGVELSIALGD